MCVKNMFSFVELLCVIAILSILASFLLPSLRIASKNAHQTVCASNMKSIGQGVLLYSSDYHGFLPPGGANWVKEPNIYRGLAWGVKIAQYIGIKGGPGGYWGEYEVNSVVLDCIMPVTTTARSIFLCPDFAADGGYSMSTTYQVTSCATKQEEVIENPGGYYLFNTNNGYTPESGRALSKRLSVVPASSVLFVEKISRAFGTPSDTNYAYNTKYRRDLDFSLPYGRHIGNVANYLAADGSVTSYPSYPSLFAASFDSKTWRFLTVE